MLNIEERGTILPFVIELDAENSNLYPINDENQRFCYSVNGIGTENSKFEDLDHLVLGIGDQIVENEITNISVRIDGVEHDVGLDRKSEYPGLIVDTNLDKTHGKMCFSFELTHPYPIGRNKVYLVGKNAVVNEASTYGPVSQELQDRYVHAYQNASVYIPVEVNPRADSGEIKTSCCGEPTVAFFGDRHNGKYCFTIIQPICVEVPLELSAEALLGNLHVTCGEETEPVCEPVCEEMPEVTEQEQPKPSPNKNWYKVYF